MASNNIDELTAELLALKDRFIERKMSESAFRHKAKDLLEAQTVNTPTQNRKAINDLLKVAKADRKLFDSLDSLTGS
ncbi:MAG: hypothetical protein OXE46_07455 [Chloroflexi bacterium]|nr:hypothetical protein [Chloroflexota bacterium]